MIPATVRSRLVDALEREGRLLGMLLDVVCEQRAGIAAEDAQRVGDSVFTAHRLIRTLVEARRWRRTLLEALTGSEDTRLDEIDAVLDDAAAASLRDVRLRVRTMARVLAREIAMNRVLIRHVLGREVARLRPVADRPVSSVDGSS